MGGWQERRPRLDTESGVGAVSSLAGVVVFLGFLLFAAQVLVHLFATSYVDAAAFDAARLASGAGDVAPATAAAHGKAVLGTFGKRATFEVTRGATRVTVRAHARSPALLPRLFGHVAGADTIDSTITLRREHPRCEGC